MRPQAGEAWSRGRARRPWPKRAEMSTWSLRNAVGSPSRSRRWRDARRSRPGPSPRGERRPSPGRRDGRRARSARSEPPGGATGAASASCTAACTAPSPPAMGSGRRRTPKVRNWRRGPSTRRRLRLRRVPSPPARTRPSPAPGWYRRLSRRLLARWRRRSGAERRVEAPAAAADSVPRVSVISRSSSAWLIPKRISRRCSTSAVINPLRQPWGETLRLIPVAWAEWIAAPVEASAAMKGGSGASARSAKRRSSTDRPSWRTSSARSCSKVSAFVVIGRDPGDLHGGRHALPGEEFHRRAARLHLDPRSAGGRARFLGAPVAERGLDLRLHRRRIEVAHPPPASPARGGNRRRRNRGCATPERCAAPGDRRSSSASARAGPQAGNRCAPFPRDSRGYRADALPRAPRHVPDPWPPATGSTRRPVRAAA